ncbi:MAG: hypothetical protein M3033_02140 [Acidobacteriota bacterium]|nr:hypothetical protein [Acidobacteriota bacterium]
MNLKYKKTVGGKAGKLSKIRKTIIGKLMFTGFAALCLLTFSASMQAQTPTMFGSLSNFDVLNDTGEIAHGFEIELDGVTEQQAYYFYTYNRYGQPTVTPFAGGVYVRYMSQWDAAAQQFTSGTPIATDLTMTTAGHQCVGTLPSGCEHFGAVTLANPTRTVYRWLLADPQNPGSLIASNNPVAIPAPVWTVQPPAQVGGAPIVAAEVVAPEPPRPEQRAGDAQWVKIYKTELPREVALEELMTDDPVVPQDAAQVEVSWDVIQDQPQHGNGNGNRTRKRNQGALSNGSHAVIRRYEFYKYTGAYDPLTNEVVCGDGNLCKTPQDGEVGDYIGAQMAAVNLEVPQLNVTETGGGSVSSADRLISCGNKCSSNYDAGTVVSLTASANSGSIFAGWSGDCAGNQVICSVTVSRVQAVSALFKTLFSLSVRTVGSGSVKSADAGIDCGKICSSKVVQGASLTFTATPAAGKQFTGWSGDCAGTSATCTISATKGLSVQANFTK